MKGELESIKNFIDAIFKRSNMFITSGEINQLKSYVQHYFNKSMSTSCHVCIRGELFNLQRFVDEQLGKFNVEPTKEELPQVEQVEQVTDNEEVKVEVKPKKTKK